MDPYSPATPNYATCGRRREVPRAGPVLGLQNTVAVNYAGNPALAIPIPLEGRGFPVTSLQLIGPNFGEAPLVNAARLLASPGKPKPIAKNER
jgi:Asp-tRNA(Asn)/Glu-tRNA(Gln) amidotransferase A subunit family amidase